MAVNWNTQQFQPQTQLDLSPLNQFAVARRDREKKSLTDLTLTQEQKKARDEAEVKEIMMRSGGNPMTAIPQLKAKGYSTEAGKLEQAVEARKKAKFESDKAAFELNKQKRAEFSTGMEKLTDTYSNLPSSFNTDGTPNEDTSRQDFYTDKIAPFIKKRTGQFPQGTWDATVDQRLMANARTRVSGKTQTGKAQFEWVPDPQDPDYEVKWAYDTNTKQASPMQNPNTGQQFRRKKEAKLTGFNLWQRKNSIKNEEDEAKRKRGKPMTSTEVKNINDIVGTAADLTKIRESIDNIADLKKGPITGYLLQKNPYDADIAVLENLITSVVPGMARGIFREVGVLTDADVERYKNLFPTVKKNPKVAKMVFDEILDKVQRGYTLTVKGYKKSGLDVGEWNPAANVYDLSGEMINPATTVTVDDINNMSEDELRRYLGE